MKEEDILLKKLGKENSFKVPDGYFENLTSEVMNKLPEKEKVVFKDFIMEPIMAPAVRSLPRAAVATGLVLWCSLAVSTIWVVTAANARIWSLAAVARII